jgi:hypothetical protein
MRDRIILKRVRPLALIAWLSGCLEATSGTLTGGTADVFTETSRVALDTAVVATIGQINDLLVLPERIIVTDGMSERVVAFTRDGQFQAAFGRAGDGPGEFRIPLALLEDVDGTILVSQTTPRLTRLTPDLEFIDVYQTDASGFIFDLALIEDQITFLETGYRAGADNYVLWDGESGRIGSFDPQSELSGVPYWNATWSTHIAIGPDQLFVADNMVYPMRRYTLNFELVDSLGVPPPSWLEARKPVLGEFAQPGQPGAQEWLRSFTVIGGLYVLDDWLIVTHHASMGQHEPNEVFRADLYRISPELRKVWEDVPLPGRIVTADEVCAWTIIESPPAPWTLACLQPRLPD